MLLTDHIIAAMLDKNKHFGAANAQKLASKCSEGLIEMVRSHLPPRFESPDKTPDPPSPMFNALLITASSLKGWEASMLLVDTKLSVRS